MTEKHTISLPEWLDAAVEAEKTDGLPTSRWYQEAAIARLLDERAGTWETPDVDEAVLREVDPPDA